MLDVHIIRMGVFISGFDKMLFVKMSRHSKKKKPKKQ